MQYFKRIGDEWRERAAELAEWTMRCLVNRTDVWGRYLAEKSRSTKDGVAKHAVTAPFRDERGKVFLNAASLEKHFKTQLVSGMLGLHSAASDLASRWLAIDIDLHDEDNLSVTAESNFAAARHWFQKLSELGFGYVVEWTRCDRSHIGDTPSRLGYLCKSGCPIAAADDLYRL